jgi:ComF family protein
MRQPLLFPRWATVLKQGVATLFQTQCPLCERVATQVFCLDCMRRLQTCQRAVTLLHPEGLPPLYGWGNYGGALKQGIVRLKYDHRPAIAQPLGRWLAQGWLDLTASSTLFAQQLPIVIPIPLHPERQQQRSYNQAERIARSFCDVAGLPLKAKGLLRLQKTAVQYELSRQERFLNLQGAFSLGPDLPPTGQSPILLVDDIFTTGATFKAATDLLNQKGFRVLGLLSVAITERERPQ